MKNFLSSCKNALDSIVGVFYIIWSFSRKNKLTKNEVEALERVVQRQVESTIFYFNDYMPFYVRKYGKTLEEKIKELENPENWEDRSGYAFKKGFPHMAGGFSESVCHNLGHMLGMHKYDLELIKVVVREASKKEPQIMAYVKGVIRGVELQNKIWVRKEREKLSPEKIASIESEAERMRKALIG